VEVAGVLNLAEWARRYRRAGNPLFVPEAMRSQDASVNGLYAYGALDAMGFSPFGIESITDPAAKYLEASFGLVAQLERQILALQGKAAMTGLLSEGPEQRGSKCSSAAMSSGRHSSEGARQPWLTASSCRPDPLRRRCLRQAGSCS
jgi:hypothetical protein